MVVKLWIMMVHGWLLAVATICVDGGQGWVMVNDGLVVVDDGLVMVNAWWWSTVWPKIRIIDNDLVWHGEEWLITNSKTVGEWWLVLMVNKGELPLIRWPITVHEQKQLWWRIVHQPEESCIMTEYAEVRKGQHWLMRILSGCPLNLRATSATRRCLTTIYLSVCLSICLSVSLSIYFSIYLSPPIHPWTYKLQTQEENTRVCTLASLKIISTTGWFPVKAMSDLQLSYHH